MANMTDEQRTTCDFALRAMRLSELTKLQQHHLRSQKISELLGDVDMDVNMEFDVMIDAEIDRRAGDEV